jgi:hypothetical protein
MANWDNEIDDAARQMTAGEPDAAFKARVLARIEAGEIGQRRGWPMWVWPAVALTAAAVLALVIVRSTSQSGNVGLTSDSTVRLKPDTTYEARPGAAAPPSTQSPVRSVSKSPVGSASQSPLGSAAQSPVRSASKSPVESAAQSPVRTAARSPVGSAARSVAGSSTRSYSTRSYVVSASRRTDAGQANDAVAQTSDLAPTPIDIEPLAVESTEAMESIQVPTLAVAQIEVPAIGED